MCYYTKFGMASEFTGSHKTSWACSVSLRPSLDQKVSFLIRHSRELVFVLSSS